MIILIAYIILLANTVLLVYAAFSADVQYREMVLQITGSVTAILFWLSEYFSQSKCDANGVIDFLLLVGEKIRSKTKNIAFVNPNGNDIHF